MMPNKERVIEKGVGTTLTRHGKPVLPAILLLLLGIVSCGTKPLEPDPSDLVIRFGAATVYQNDIQTRTEYSGFDENGNFLSSSSKFERIDWVAGHDRIRILCAQARVGQSGDYEIGIPTANGKDSEADATLVAGKGLHWAKDVQHSFYALYPAPGTTSNYHDATASESESRIELQGDGTAARITGSIPGTQPLVAKEEGAQVFMPNMNLAYMYAKKRTAQTDDSHVQLEFYPLVTSMEFSLMASDEAMELYDLVSVTLVSASTNLWGNFTAALDAGDAAAPVVTETGSYSDANKTLKVTLPSGTKLSRTAYTKVTFIALGVAQTDLTVKLNFSNGHSRTTVLKKKDNSMVSVAACKKVYFKLGVPGEEIFFEVTPMAEDPFDGENPAYQVVTRGLDPIDNSTDRGLLPQRYGVFAIRNAEGVRFNAAGNEPNWYLVNRDVSHMETPEGEFDPLSSADTYWRGNAPAFWPSYDYLNFFAYAPLMERVQPYVQGEATVIPPLVFPSSDYTSGMPRATYTPSSNVTTQVDLCIAPPRFDRMRGDNPVPLSFKHALTRIRLYVRVKGSRQPEYQYRVTNVAMSGLVGTNTFTYVENETMPFRWDTVDGATLHETGYNLSFEDTQLTSEWVKFIGDEVGSGVTDPYTWVNAPFNGRMYLLPQPITSSAELEIAVSLYKVNGASATRQSILPPFKMHLPTETAWESGKTVSYLITVDASKLVVLDIRAMVTDWADAGNTHPEQIIF